MTDVSTWVAVIFRVKWRVFIRWWYLCLWSWLLIGQFCRDVIGHQNVKVVVIGHLFYCYFRSIYCLFRSFGLHFTKDSYITSNEIDIWYSWLQTIDYFNTVIDYWLNWNLDEKKYKWDESIKKRNCDQPQSQDTVTEVRLSCHAHYTGIVLVQNDTENSLSANAKEPFLKPGLSSPLVLP